MFTCDTCFNPTNPFILLFYLTTYTILRVVTTFIPNVPGVDLALVNISSLPGKSFNRDIPLCYSCSLITQKASSMMTLG